MCSADNKSEFWPLSRKPRSWGRSATWCRQGNPNSLGRRAGKVKGEDGCSASAVASFEMLLLCNLEGEWGAAEPEPAVCRGLLCFHMSFSLKSLPRVVLL